MDTETLKIVFGWGYMKATDLVPYVPEIISVEDFKYITGEDFSKYTTTTTSTTTSTTTEKPTTTTTSTTTEKTK